MKALVFEETGEPQEVLKLADILKPEPGPDDVRLKVLGCPIDPADELFIEGRYRYRPVFPQTAGLEGAGLIDAVGKNVDLPQGALASFLYGKAWAEYTVIPQSLLFVLPDDFPVEKAIQFSLNPFTTWGLLEKADLESGDWLLMTAGNSAVARIITQIARVRGINVILTVRSPGHSEGLKALGASEVINTSDQTVIDEVQRITDGEGVTCVIDAVGGKTGTEVLQCLAPNGKMIIYGLLSPDNVRFHNSLFIYKNVSISGFGVRGFLEKQSSKQRKEMVDSLIDLMGNDRFQLDVTTSYPPDKFKEAFAAFKQRGKMGKVIFKM